MDFLGMPVPMQRQQPMVVSTGEKVSNRLTQERWKAIQGIILLEGYGWWKVQKCIRQ